MIRVAFVIGSLNIGGAELQLLSLLERLDRSRFEAMLFVLGEGSLIPRVPHDVPVEAGIWSHGADPRAVRRLAASLGQWAPDVAVQYGRTAVGLTGRLAAKRAGVSVVVQAVHSNRFTWEEPRRGLHNVLNRFIDSWTDEWICVSRSQAMRLEAAGVPANAIRVIYNGVDLAEFHPAHQPVASSAQDTRVAMRVIAVGGFREVKRYDVLVQALGIAVARGVDVHATLVGDGETRATIESLVAASGLDAHVRFAGSTDGVAALLRSADVLVSSSDSESFSLVAAEAMACALPVVATRSGGIEEIVVDGETGYLVAPGDSEGIASSLGRLSTDPELGRRMGRLGLERVRTMFSIAAMVEGYEALLEELACR